MTSWTQEEKYLLGQVLPGIAAQLRQPLNNLAMALQCAVPEDAPRQEAAVTQQSYYRMLRLVNHLGQAPELLDDTPLEKENIDVCWLFEELCAEAEGLFAEKGVGLTFVCREEGHIAALHCDYSRRMLWNLLSNALKYTPKGGSVTVTLKFESGQMLLQVADTGCGIAPEAREKVFDRWRYAQENTLAGQGFGLGLPLSQHIAERQGGRLLLNDRPGGGIAVTVALPDRKMLNGKIKDKRFDYAGGFRPVLLELSDALPYTAFLPENLE